MCRFITKHGLGALLRAAAGKYDVFVPAQREGRGVYTRLSSNGAAVETGPVRTVDPLKAFFVKPRECVAEGFSPVPPLTENRPLCVVGVKACDLKGFRIQDFVFAGEEFRDPFYCRARNESLIISSDCTSALDTCFCEAFDERPYPRGDFDLNLSPVDGGYVVEMGSEKGAALIASCPGAAAEAAQGQTEARDRQRDEVSAKVRRNLKEFQVPSQQALEESVERHYESTVWKEEAETCVECGACNTICPTCHCFLLYDQKDAARMVRFRAWDSCLMKGFARVAGGANPRRELSQRLRNRFEKKFSFFPKVAGEYACTGCGRCISACPGKIDIRRVMKRLSEHV
ncbi:MAG TPA: 4Fe-4S dicluster domain-containing protein [Candidatus Hydrogenedentes bacterium]|nr:4Fe-4S dicluster domain-containing protein [Candidatus Hydrogenedentota bacterium]HQE81439.1 4Fe-4S dicluster domain-containing protein [Candidatus Hydrogenedentota bacterium]HQH54889.1 4Fe-4S dicluster domain-containing protein [Candidatus Hydrogenedentota bacterium]